MKAGRISAEDLHRRQRRCTTHAFRHGSEGFQGPTESIVVEQHARSAQDLM
jgi:hypothetical protein